MQSHQFKNVMNLSYTLTKYWLLVLNYVITSLDVLEHSKLICIITNSTIFVWDFNLFKTLIFSLFEIIYKYKLGKSLNYLWFYLFNILIDVEF